MTALKAILQHYWRGEKQLRTSPRTMLFLFYFFKERRFIQGLHRQRGAAQKMREAHELRFKQPLFLLFHSQMTWLNPPHSSSLLYQGLALGGGEHGPRETQAGFSVSINRYFTAIPSHWALRMTYFTWLEFLQMLYQLLLPVFQLLGSTASGLAEVPQERQT